MALKVRVVDNIGEFSDLYLGKKGSVLEVISGKIIYSNGIELDNDCRGFHSVDDLNLFFKEGSLATVFTDI